MDTEKKIYKCLLFEIAESGVFVMTYGTKIDYWWPDKAGGFGNGDYNTIRWHHKKLFGEEHDFSYKSRE